MIAGEAALDEARRVLQERFGFADFRPGQEEIVAALLAGEDILAVMPTGAGKSLLYQLPAAMGRGLALVVSPLISLMRDQLRMVQESGVAAAALHSGQDDAEAQAAVAGVVSGRVKLLYAAPERLASDSLAALLDKAPLGLFAVDEAHCVSHWGHEFRPEYARLKEFAQRLRAPQILAVTATAGPRTRAEIAERLFLRPPRLFLRSFARPNLALGFRPRLDAVAQAAAMIEKFRGESGVVYCASRRGADSLAGALRARGYEAFAYHAGLDAGTRAEHQDLFASRRGVVMVATIAFGMGVDKKDVRFILHIDPPESVEAYYQEVGRAGRDGAPAEALCLYDARDLAARLTGDAAEEGAAQRRRAMARLCLAPGCRSVALLAAFGEAGGRCGVCDNCRGGLLSWPRRAGAAARLLRISAAARLTRELSLAPDETTSDMVSGDRFADDGFANDAAEASERSARARAVFESALRIGDERRLRALERVRRDIARERRLPPCRIVGDAFLLALLRDRPSTPAAPPFDAAEAQLLRAADVTRFLRILETMGDD